MGLFTVLESKLKVVQPRDPWQRWLPMYGAACGLCLWTLDVIYGQDFPWVFLVVAGYLVLAVLLSAVVVLNWRHWRYGVPTLVAFVGVSLLVFSNSYAIRSTCRWCFKSPEYKAELLAQGAPQPGELKHIEWDGWGMAGQDTTVYLVFDPDESLYKAAENKDSGKLAGIPCGAWQVRRLEHQWYSVVLYTNTVWEYCG